MLREFVWGGRWISDAGGGPGVGYILVSVSNGNLCRDDNGGENIASALLYKTGA